MLNEHRAIMALFASTERMLGVYRKPGLEQTKYYALNPDTPMPEQHPIDRDYRLTGILDPRTGAITAPGQSGGHAEATAPSSDILAAMLRGVWWMVTTAFAVVAWVGIAVTLGLLSKGGGGRGKTRW